VMQIECYGPPGMCASLLCMRSTIHLGGSIDVSQIKYFEKEQEWR
jgi:hypothetical protein